MTWHRNRSSALAGAEASMDLPFMQKRMDYWCARLHAYVVDSDEVSRTSDCSLLRSIHQSDRQICIFSCPVPKELCSIFLLKCQTRQRYNICTYLFDWPCSALWQTVQTLVLLGLGSMKLNRIDLWTTAEILSMTLINLRWWKHAQNLQHLPCENDIGLNQRGRQWYSVAHMRMQWACLQS